MRPTIVLSYLLLSLPISAVRIPSITAAFYEAFLEDHLLANISTIGNNRELVKRQAGGCPARFNPCAGNGYGGACCTSGSICTTDVARNVACCPNGATCTGTVLAGAPVSTTQSGGVFGTTSTNAPTITTGPVAIVTNPYFPFPIIATSYSNSAACNSAFEACQSNYAACTANLQGGGGFGVTVVAPQGGVTVAPTAQNLGPASATSVCSSLSRQACYGIVSENCAQFGQGTGGSFVVNPTGNPAARQTLGCFATAGMMAGVGLGIAGQMI